jgi:uroporphyrinogen-III synthase
MHLIITRPEEDATALKSKLENSGHAVSVAPLLKIVPRAEVEIPFKPYQIICATSANALKYAELNEALKQIKVLTVGPQSLAAARKAGFLSCKACGGDVDGLATYIIENFNPESGPILYLSGAETSADLQSLLRAAHFAVEKIIIYDAVVQKPDNIAALLSIADGVLLYSRRSARIWADMVKTGKLEKLAASPIYFCLSDNVARALPPGWRTCVANSPDESAMLALLA